MEKHDRVWKSMVENGKAQWEWKSIVENGKAWESMKKHSREWKSMVRMEKHGTCLQCALAWVSVYFGAWAEAENKGKEFLWGTKKLTVLWWRNRTWGKSHWMFMSSGVVTQILPRGQIAVKGYLIKAKVLSPPAWSKFYMESSILELMTPKKKVRSWCLLSACLLDAQYMISRTWRWSKNITLPQRNKRVYMVCQERAKV